MDKQIVSSLMSKVAIDSNQNAFKMLFDKFYPRLLNFCETFIKSRESAEEIVEDVFMNIWLNRHNLPNIENFSFYMYRAVKNKSINFVNRNKAIGFVDIDEIDYGNFAFEKSPEQLLITAEVFKEIENSINQLPPKCKLIFKLVKEDGLKYAEAAEVLGVSVKSIEAQVATALNKMSLSLKDGLPEFVKITDRSKQLQK